jgi:glycosyltransferase involved in cell wall biosynthesis
VKVLMVSKALVIGAYRGKLTELAKLGLEVVAVVPPEWREGGSTYRLEADSDLGYELVVSSMRWNGHFHFHFYPELPDLIRRIRPDIVHLDEEPYNLATFLGVRAAARSSLPSLFFSWQNLVRRYPPPFAQMERSVYRLASHGLAGTKAVASVLREKGYDKGLSVVPQFGVNPEVARPGAQPHDGFVIGFLNRLIPAKAPILSLDALEMLPDDSRLCVVGDGPLRPQLEVEVERRGLARRVTLRSRVPSAEIPNLMHGLDTVILPSLTTPRWKEQFGRVLIEAMACGVPVVGSDSGEIPAVIGDAGLIVPEGDARALAAALQCLYDDCALRKDLSRRGRLRVFQHFTHARVARLTYDAYLEAAAATSIPPPPASSGGSRFGTG